MQCTERKRHVHAQAGPLTDHYGVQRLRNLVRSEALFDDLVPLLVVGHQPAGAREKRRAEGIGGIARAAGNNPAASLECYPCAVEERQHSERKNDQPQHVRSSQSQGGGQPRGQAHE